MTDLLGSGDDLQRLVTTDDPDSVWDEVVRWPRYRSTAALVAAVGIIQDDGSDEMAGGNGHHPSASGQQAGGQDTTRTPADSH